MHAKPTHSDRSAGARGVPVLLLACTLMAACSHDTALETPGKPLAAEPDTDAAGNIADLADDALLAPLAPSLTIEAAPGTLSFHWDSDFPGQTGTLYHLDGFTGIESPVQAIDSAAGSLTLDVSALALDWLHSQYRVAWCDGDDCVSSHYNAIADLLPTAIESLDGYAATDTLVSNDNARLLAHLDAQGDTLHLDLLSGGDAAPLSRHTQSIQLSWPVAAPARSLALASDAGGDTLAALRYDPASGLHLNAIDRLGETWIDTGTLSLAIEQQIATRLDEARPLSLRSDDVARLQDEATDDTVQLSARYSSDGSRLLVSFHATDGHVGRLSLLLLVRDGFDWVLAHETQLAPGANWLPASAANDSLDTLYAAEYRSDGVHVLRVSLDDPDRAPSPTGIVVPVTNSQFAMTSAGNATRLLIATLETSPGSTAALLQEYRRFDSERDNPEELWQPGDSWRGPTRVATARDPQVHLASDRDAAQVVLTLDDGLGAGSATLLRPSPAGWRDTLRLEPAHRPVHISANGSLLLSGHQLLR